MEQEELCLSSAEVESVSCLLSRVEIVANRRSVPPSTISTNSVFHRL